MKLRNLIRNAFLIGSIVTLASCKSMNKSDGSQTDVADANSAYNSQVDSSGMGEGGSFNGEGGSRSGSLASKRIYYFDFDSTVVQANDKPAIYANADYLIAHPNAKILLEGHTDPRGSREYNIGLGERRAQSIAAILQSRGVNPSQIRIISYGAEKLAMNGHTESDYEQDRRSVLAYLQQ